MVEEGLFVEGSGDRKKMRPALKNKLNDPRVIREELEGVARGVTAGPQG